VRVTRDVDLTASWTGYARVEVRVVNGTVELRSGETNDVRVTGNRSVGGLTLDEANANLDKVEVYAGTRSGRADTLLVELRYPEELRTKSPGAKLLIQVPEACPADVLTSNGSIRATGMKGNVMLHSSNGSIIASKIDGPLDTETSNGNVEVTGTSGNLKASTCNGRIVARNVNGACELDTSNGGIELSEVQGSVRAETSNGGIRVAVTPPADGRVDLRTSNGGIHLTLPADLPAGLEAGTSNGQVHVGLAEGKLAFERRSKTSVKANFNGGGCPVRLTTSNGGITIDSH
jgi:DUF4097 and DUF4098 domain-containing protein YvlB